MSELLTPKAVQKEYGYNLSSLKRWEAEGKLTGVQRTPGGHRRYTREGLEALSQPVAKAQEIPKVPTSPRDRALYNELGSTGLTRFGGSVAEEKLRELRGRAGRILKREMRLNDPVIAAVFFALSNALKQASWRVSPASEEQPDLDAADFIDSCLDDMSFTWQDTLTFIIDPMLEQGFSLLELVYKQRLGVNPPRRNGEPLPKSKFDDGRVGWRKFAPRPAESLVDGNEWIFDEAGGIKGFNQLDNNGKLHTVPIEKALHFRTTVHPANTPEPPPIHRPAYLPYYYTNNLQDIEAIGIERDLGGLPVVYLGNDRSYDGSNSDYELAKDMVVNIRRDEQMGVVIPGPKMGSGAAEGEGWLFELLSSTGSRSHDTGGVIERYNKLKALVVLAQFIMLGMDQVGSYALSRHQGDMFTLAATAWVKSIADIINRHAITRLMAFNNFPGITGMPELVPSPLGIPDLVTVAEYVNKLVDKQLITPDAELERHLRMIAELPELPEDVERPVGKADISDLSLLTSRVRLALEPLEELGVIEAGATGNLLRPIADRLVSGLVMDGEIAKAHEGEPLGLPCPFCSGRNVEQYKDHDGVANCPDCEMTFDPEFHFGSMAYGLVG